jgi:hypothetical protein
LVSVLDADPDPAYWVNRYPDPGFRGPKMVNLQVKKFDQNLKFLSLSIQEGSSRYRRSLQLSKDNIQLFQT